MHESPAVGGTAVRAVLQRMGLVTAGRSQRRPGGPALNGGCHCHKPQLALLLTALPNRSYRSVDSRHDVLEIIVTVYNVLKCIKITETVE